MSAAAEHVRQSASQTPAGAPIKTEATATPPRQRPAVNGSLGEGSDALDAPELRRKRRGSGEPATPDLSFLAPPTSFEAPAVLPTSPRASIPGVPPIPRVEARTAPPLTSEVVARAWSDPESQAERGQRSAENGGPAPLWLEALANQFGVRARFIPLHRPSNTISRYVDPCDKRDYRCQEFHDNFFREDVETSPLGMANSIGAGFAGGIVRAVGANREIKAPLMWTVKPRFVGLEAAF